LDKKTLRKMPDADLKSLAAELRNDPTDANINLLREVYREISERDNPYLKKIKCWFCKEEIFGIYHMLPSGEYCCRVCIKAKYAGTLMEKYSEVRNTEE